METYNVLLIIGLMALVTAPVRVLPLWLLGGRAMAQPVRTWLSFVPAAAIAAMLLPSLLLVERGPKVHWATLSDNVYLMAALPTAWVAAKTKNLALAVCVGVTVTALLRQIVGAV